MQTIPSFQLVPPVPPAWDACQEALFSDNGQATSSRSESESLARQVSDLLSAIGIPAHDQFAYVEHLCNGHWIDPALVTWLSPPERSFRLQIAFDDFESRADAVALDKVRTRAHALLVYAKSTRDWPCRAHDALKQQRPSSGAFDRSLFPPLPEPLRAMRHTLLKLAMQARALVYESFATPANEVIGHGIRSVEVLGSFRLHFNEACRDITTEQLGEAGWSSGNTAHVDVARPLPTDAWSDCFVYRLAHEMRMALGRDWNAESTRGQTIGWLTDVIKAVAQHSHLLEHVRETIRRGYRCDRQIIADAYACTIDRRPRQGLTALRYRSAWRMAKTLRKRVSEAPRLAAVWGMAFSLNHIAAHDDYDVLKAHFRRAGITQNGWKLLSRYGRLLYRPMMGPRRHLALEYDNFVLYLHLLQRMQVTEPLPFALAQALFAAHWFDLNPNELPLGLVRGATERLRQAQSLGAQDAFIADQFVPVLGWIARAEPEFDTHQQRASWDWFFTRYTQWSETERLKREGERWTQGIDGLRWRGFDVVPIRDSATLWIEGEQMRTCLSRYAKDCLNGTYLVYSVRAKGRARPVAHIGLYLDGDGKAGLDQIRGFANSVVEPALAEYANRMRLLRH